MGKKNLPRLQKKAHRGFRGYPLATIALYGPTDAQASKIVVSIFDSEGAEPTMERWFSEVRDIRHDADIEDQMILFLRNHGVLTVAAPDRIIGCPHEEGIDYPEGKSCPQCPFWAGRDRWTGERLQ
jgi:hypothetical protein